MSPLERLIVALVGLEGEEAAMPLSVLLPLYRRHLAEPAMKLLELYEQDRDGALTVIESLYNPENLYWFDISMHYNDQDLVNKRLMAGINRLAATQDPLFHRLEAMVLEDTRLQQKSSWSYFFIRILYVAAHDKTVAAELPRLEPYLEEVAAMVEQGYPRQLQLP